MISPAYRAAHNDEVPVITTAEGAIVRVIAGAFIEVVGPITEIVANPTYLQVSLPANTSLTIPAPEGNTAFAYLYRGDAFFGANKKSASALSLCILAEQGNVVTITTEEVGAKFMFACAPPWNEPVLQYRSLVLSNVAEMQQALEDLENGTFA